MTMIPAYVHGPIAPTFTAFSADGQFDEKGQRALFDYLLDAGGISAFFVRSGMGQMFTFSFDDARAMARVACAHLRGRAPVLVGATGIWDRDPTRKPDPKTFIEQAVALSRYAEEQGADGIVHTVPEAIVPEPGESTSDIALRYFETVSAAVSLPVFIYQSPGTAAEYELSPETLGRLADIPNVVGGKFSTTDAGYLCDLAWATAGKDFALITGNETVFYAGLIIGSTAVIGQGATMNPHILTAVQDRFERGDREGALVAQHSVNLLVRRARNSTEFLKRYAAEKGYAVPPYARPMRRDAYAAGATALTDAEYTEYKALFEAEAAKFS